VKVAVLGVGLIGGSIGLAARARAGARVTGWDADPSVGSSARAIGAIDEDAARIADAVSGAHVVFVAVPVGSLAQTVQAALDAAGPDTVVTDVGSTKRAVADAISDPRFIAGHPLAGSELAGVEHAREDLFEGATWFLCGGSAGGSGFEGSSGEEDFEGLAGEGGLEGQAGGGGRELAGGAGLERLREPSERLRELIASFGAAPVEIDAATHDRLMATVSQLPHVLANLLVAQAAVREAGGRSGGAAGNGSQAREGSGTGARSAVGPSFRDATRVAGSNSAIWTDIYMSNRAALIAAIDELIPRLEQVRAVLREGDAEALTEWNEQARAQREALLGPDS
jgi:prephenate dehydrogenase